MRRPLAIILALFFALGPLYAVFGSSEDSRLPACCRRNGAHHCEMNAEMLAALAKIYSGTPSFAAPSSCSEFPSSAMGFSTPSHALTTNAIHASVVFEQTDTQVALSATPRLIPIRLHAGRAPPASI